MNYPYSFHFRSKDRNIHKLWYLCSEFDYFGEEELNSFFSHDLQAPETEAFQNYQNN